MSTSAHGWHDGSEPASEAGSARIVPAVERAFFEIVSTSVPYPLSVQIETTTRCNLRCIMCPKGANGEVMGDLDPRILDRIGGLIDNAWEIRPHGFGEAFLNRDLAHVLERAGRSHASISIVTNGTVINEDWARLLVDTRVDRLYVSLDAADPQLFREIRKTKLEKILVNVRRLQAIKAEQGARLPNITLQMVGMSNNIHDLPAMVRLASSLGAEEVNVVAFTEFDTDAVHAASLKSLLSVPELARTHLGAARRLARELGVRLEVAPIYHELMPPPEPEAALPVLAAAKGSELEALARKAVRRFRERPLDTLGLGVRRAGAYAAAQARTVLQRWRGSDHDERSRIEPPAHDPPRPALRPKVRCQDPWNAVVVNWKGEVNPCCMSQRVMGNVNDARFEQIWDDVPYRAFREQLLSDEPPDECRGCAKAGWYQPYELEDWIEVGVNDVFGVQLGTGWCDAANGVRWGRKEAMLRLRNSGKRRLRLVLTSWPDEWKPVAQRGSISVNGQPVGGFELSTFVGEALTFPLPESDDAQLVVRIVCDWERAPLGGEGEGGRLGIGLKSAALVGDPLPDRERMARGLAEQQDPAR